MQNNAILITGSTSGLGLALAEQLVQREHTTLLLHGRDPEQLSEIQARFSNAPADVRTLVADLSELAQVRELAASVGRHTDRLTVLVNNAGIGFGSETRGLSPDGHELRFAVNYLASFALTGALLPLLRAGAQSTTPSRVINIASIGQAPIDFDDINIDREYDGRRAYGQSKLAMITSGFTLAGNVDPDEIVVNSIHPATFMPTKMVLDAGIHAVDDLESGRDAVLRLILDPAIEGVTGRFFNGLEEARAHESAYDPVIQRRLWDVSSALIEHVLNAS